MDHACIRIDMMKLTKRLERVHGKRYTYADSMEWLESQSLRHEGQQWYCDGHALDALQTDEIIELLRHETEGGMTYFSHEMRPRQ